MRESPSFAHLIIGYSVQGFAHLIMSYLLVEL